MNIALGLKRLQLSTVFFRQMGLSLTAQGGTSENAIVVAKALLLAPAAPLQWIVPRC